MLAKKIALARFRKEPEPFRKIEFPSLRDIAIEEVAKNFHMYPHLNGISQSIREIIISKTSSTLPVTITYNSIQTEDYWKQACEKRWKDTHRTINIERHGLSYKVAFMENYLEEYLRGLKTLEDPEAKTDLITQLKSVSNWIYTLNISQLQCAIDIGIICQYLPCLTELTLVYGVKTSGMDYKKKALGMKLSQAAELGEALSKYCCNLLTLKLPSNLIDDDLLRFIMAGINMNISIIELNLSHNRIGDQGYLIRARRIAKFLMRTDLLLILDLSNNQIGYDGSRYISQALKINKSLQTLNLSLNMFNDKAGMKFFKDLNINKQITEFNVAGNMLGYQSALKISDYVADSQCTLKSLTIGNNNFSDDCFEILKIGLTKNYSLEKIDITECKFQKGQNYDYDDVILDNAEKELQDIIIKHHLNHIKLPFISKEEFLSTVQQKIDAKKENQKDGGDKVQTVI